MAYTIIWNLLIEFTRGVAESGVPVPAGTQREKPVSTENVFFGTPGVDSTQSSSPPDASQRRFPSLPVQRDSRET